MCLGKLIKNILRSKDVWGCFIFLVHLYICLLSCHNILSGMIMSMDTPTGSSISSNTWKNRILANFQSKSWSATRNKNKTHLTRICRTPKWNLKCIYLLDDIVLYQFFFAQLLIFFRFSFRYIITGYHSSKILHQTKNIDEKYWIQIVTSRQTHL